MEKYTFHILGCRGSRPVSGESYQQFGGATSCYLLVNGQHAIVLDCGTGLYNAKSFLNNCRQIDVLLTHLHYDHILGLLNLDIFPADADVRFFLGGEAKGIVRITDFLQSPYWPISPDFGEIIYVDSEKTLQLTEDTTARFFPANHPDTASVVGIDTGNGSLCLM